MVYLLAQIWIQLLLAGAIGLLAGYVLWGARQRQRPEHEVKAPPPPEADLAQQRRITDLKARLRDATARLDRCRGDRLRKDARIRDLESLLDEVRGEAAFTAPLPDPDITPIRPEGRDAPRAEGADDLTRIRGIGPKLQSLCHGLGLYHYDQIAALTAAELAWIDAHLPGFPGRASRDDWPAQARRLLKDRQG